MPAVSLPDDASLEQLRKQAKDVRDLARAGVPGAWISLPSITRRARTRSRRNSSRASLLKGRGPGGLGWGAGGSCLPAEQ